MLDRLGPYELNSIITGDARELSKAIPDESVDLIFTDPPWGINFKYSNGYNDSPDSYFQLVSWLVIESNRILKPGRFAFVHVATKRLRETWQHFPLNIRLFSSCKNFIQIKGVPVEYAVDYILFWQKDGTFPIQGMNRDWFLSNTAITSNGSRGLGYGERKKETSPPRPLDTIINIISQMTDKQEVVIDFFMGSGTTAVACKSTSRNYWGCEIVTETADFARERVAQTQPPLPIVMPEQLSLIEVA